MNILAEPFSIPKRGNKDDENDDAVWPPHRSEYQERLVRFAVADGATESVFARRWAGNLVQAVGENRLSLLGVSDEINCLRNDWHAWLSQVKLAWYAEEKARQGTYAALVGFEIWSGQPELETNQQWCAAAIGDSCFFHVRGDEVKLRFPLETSDAFDHRPFLLGSLAGDEQAMNERLVQCHGSWLDGDVFYLMTDALACWFISQIELGNKPLKELQEFASSIEPARFSTWIESLRDDGLIRNDDSTLLRISVR
jgi:hypothetical protein